MNWSDIRYFLAVAHGGLTSAAKQLGVSRRAKRIRVVSDLLAQVVQGQ
jgi:DNA-binding transcriptional LysR family regulator